MASRKKAMRKPVTRDSLLKMNIELRSKIAGKSKEIRELILRLDGLIVINERLDAEIKTKNGEIEELKRKMADVRLQNLSLVSEKTSLEILLATARDKNKIVQGGIESLERVVLKAIRGKM